MDVAGLVLVHRSVEDVVEMMLDGIDGELTSLKWAKLAKCSQDTDHRDILALIKHGILIKDRAGGRSTSYSLMAAPGRRGDHPRT